ncbi:MAG: enoyl-CoA hydratase/isomerase family protein, partial [Actinomycetota bacterium]
TGSADPVSSLTGAFFIEQLAAANARVRAIHKPTVAAVHGMCMGSGLGLLAQFDFVIAADDCRFGLVEGRIGHPGATEIVPIVGPAWAKFLMMTGEIINAARAEKIGLVLTTEPADELLERCSELARRLSRMPREATVLNKATINGVADAMGRKVGTAVGRALDVITRDMSRMAKSPDGRLFDEILRVEGMDALKQARDQQFKGSWLRP